MTKEFAYFSLITALGLLLFFSPSHSATIITSRTLVVIDPGHTPGKPGLSSPSGFREHDAALALAHHLKKALSTRCRVELTKAENPSHEERAAHANRVKATLFISLHFQDKRGTQPAIFYYDLPDAKPGNTWQTVPLNHQDISRKFAQALSQEYKSNLPESSPLVLSGPVSALAGLTMPGILIEPLSLSALPSDPAARDALLSDHARIIASAALGFLDKE